MWKSPLVQARKHSKHRLLILMSCVSVVASAIAMTGGHSAVSAAATSSAVLLGDTHIESTGDSASGTATEAFGYTAVTSGTAHSISVYLNSTDGVHVALYADKSSHPGALLDQASVRSNASGWVTVPLSRGISITSGTRYWLALGAARRSGYILYVDTYSGSGLDYSGSGFTNPFTTAGQRTANPVSMYLSGATSGTTPTTAPTATTTAPSTTTTAPSTTTTAPSTTTTAPSTTSTTVAQTTTTTTAGTSGTWSCVTSAQYGHCPFGVEPYITGGDQTNNPPYVDQNVWSPITGWKQTLDANSPAQWQVVANMPTGNTSVVSYPNVGSQAYDGLAVDSFSQFTSSFSENMNATANTSGWGMYDLWFNNSATEVMIQYDFANNGDCSPVATATFGGSNGVPTQQWHLCDFGSTLAWKLGAGEGSQKQSEQTSSVDLLAMIKWLEGHGYLPAGSTWSGFSDGWEICSTGGQNETFQMPSFSITAH